MGQPAMLSLTARAASRLENAALYVRGKLLRADYVVISGGRGEKPAAARSHLLSSLLCLVPPPLSAFVISCYACQLICSPLELARDGLLFLDASGPSNILSLSSELVYGALGKSAGLKTDCLYPSPRARLGNS